MILYKNYSSCLLFAWHGSPELDVTHCQGVAGTFQNIFCRLLPVAEACRLWRRFQSNHQQFGKVLYKLFLHCLHDNICQSSLALNQYSISLLQTIRRFLNNASALSFLRLLYFICHFFFLVAKPLGQQIQEIELAIAQAFDIFGTASRGMTVI